MHNRLHLHEVFCDILESRNAYFQPPPSVKMNYPAIVYSRDEINNTFADNSVYAQSVLYHVTVIDKDPDSEIVMKISKLPTCKHNRSFQSDNLNHDVFTLKY